MREGRAPAVINSAAARESDDEDGANRRSSISDAGDTSLTCSRFASEWTITSELDGLRP
jgi:hypothetical protein